MNKLNERAWAGQLIAWIQEAISNGMTLFQHASNDEGIKVASGRTKFPDILLFTDKTSGIIFNGWELKFPDTAADNIEMLENALEKAARLKAESFVTWNGSEAIIWQTDEKYSLNGLKRLKTYPKIAGIETRNDLAEPKNYRKHEAQLKERLYAILHDLEQLYLNGALKVALNISDEIIMAVQETAELLAPQFHQQIIELKNNSPRFRRDFNLWKIHESATFSLLATSSRRVEVIEPEFVLAKFTYYKFISKIIFYLTLAENLSSKVPKIEFSEPHHIKEQLNYFFEQAQKIDYQAVFQKDFTDELEFNSIIDILIFKLIEVFNKFDFKVLPSTVIGNILENLVPQAEKQKFGQYFTPELLTYLVAFSAIKHRNFVVMDPTSGTGTFLSAFYNILNYFGQKNHQILLSQIWGNDISHFPAVLSVINLYKQRVQDIANFPRITRNDYFALKPNQIVLIPDNKDISQLNQVKIPLFDAIISNFPFIQQEDIPNKILTQQFKLEFNQSQSAFFANNNFNINERSDYYIYCFYNSLKFLKSDGYLTAITSNAWLGKNYGKQFKRFLLDNFSIQYVVKSNAEHWFKNSQVSTIFITLQRGTTDAPTKFITINVKLEDFLNAPTLVENLQRIEDFYTQIDFCDASNHLNWSKLGSVFQNQEKTVKVSVVSREKLLKSIETEENWETYFIAENPFVLFEDKLIHPHGTFFTNGRGTRTGQDEMHILNQKDLEKLEIEELFLQPVLQSSRHLSSILHDQKPNTFLFICDKPETVLKKDYPRAYAWIKKWEMAQNKTGILLPKVFENRKPFWYTLKPEQPANIFISINPDKKLFFSYSHSPVHLNQRLVAIRANSEDATIIAALLNSIVSLLVVELNGVSRNLGALDLNADFFKTKMRILNPDLLTTSAKAKIITKFEVLNKRNIENYDLEFKRKDRIAFDTAILQAYGYPSNLLPQLYELLIETIRNRVEMKRR